MQKPTEYISALVAAVPVRSWSQAFRRAAGKPRYALFHQGVTSKKGRQLSEDVLTQYYYFQISPFFNHDNDKRSKKSLGWDAVVKIFSVLKHTAPPHTHTQECVATTRTASALARAINFRAEGREQPVNVSTPARGEPVVGKVDEERDPSHSKSSEVEL